MIFIGLVLSMTAQADDYDPTNPADPYMNYKVTASVTPDGAGTASTTGKYKPGTGITMNTSANKDYTFLRWEKNGVEYTTSKSFKYTVEAANVDFVAVYEYSPAPPEIYNPANPADPFFTEKPETVYYTLTLVGNPVEACSFNLSSGISVEQDTFVKLEAYGNQNYDFVGWYQNGRKVGSTEAFNYQMTSNATLTAMYKVYDPADPDDPASSMENTPRYKLGDVNDDGEINTTDAVMVINYYLGKLSTINKSVGDMNKDGSVNTTDAVAIINKYLNPVTVSSLTLSKSELEIAIGESEQLSVTILPNDAVNKKVTWSSSNPAVATVDQSGNVVAASAGTCVITCSATDGSGVKATCNVSVIEIKEYTEIEYVYNTSNAYINTGFNPTQDTRIVTEIEFPNSTFTNGYYKWHGAFGSMLGTSHVGQCRGLFWGNSRLTEGWFALTNSVDDYNETSMSVNTRYHIDWNKNDLYINDELKHTFNSSANYTGRTPLFIFGVPIESSTTPKGYAQFKLYSFKVYENNVLKLDLIPVIRKSDQKVCLYDKVGKNYFLPNNTTLTAGPNK